MNEPRLIDLSLIRAGANDRTRFGPKALQALADSIAANGLIQPITVREAHVDGEPLGLYEIVAGERRFRAMTLLGWTEAPALVADLTEEEAAAVMLSENVGREDLDPIDEARAYQARLEKFGWSVDRIAKQAGVTPVRVRFRLKLLTLLPELQALVRTGDLALGYAQILSDAGLDRNRQRLALGKLRDNPSPTPPWFRRLCGELGAGQAQEALLDREEFALAAPAAPQSSDDRQLPPLPGETAAPIRGKTLPEILAGQAAFWEEAGAAWGGYFGKPFKKNECEAAALALRSLIDQLSGGSGLSASS